MQITLTKLYRSDKNKDGTPLINKNGKPYTRLGIKCQEYGDKWISGFGSHWNADWKEGDKVEVEVKEVGQYFNFERIDPLALLEARVKALEDAVFNEAPQDPIAEEDMPPF